MVSSLGIIGLDNRKSKEIDLYKVILQALTFVAITSVCISSTMLEFGIKGLPWIS